MVAKPVYELTAPFSIFALPSMYIVPFTVSTLFTASQVRSPPTVWQLYEAAGVRSTTDGMLLFRFVRSTFGSTP